MRIFVSFFLCSLLAAGSGPRGFSDGPHSLDASVRTQPLNSGADIRIDVNMTLVPVAVLDKTGRSVLGLTRENFRVIDGSDPRPIISFSQQDAAVTVGLVYDCSRSMIPKFKMAVEAPSELYKRLNPEDESFLVTVSDRALLRQDFTTNFTDIRNSLLFTHPDGSTALVDGVYMALQRLKQGHNPRKALVIVSDGGENNSRYSMRELIRMANEADAQIFAICLYQGPQTVEEAEGPELLGDLVRSSGGVNYLISDLNDLQSAMAQIGTALHNEYVLGYYPPDGVASGKYHKITVKVMLPVGSPRLQVYARTGYYAPGR